MTDNEVLARYRRGDADALEELVEKYKRPLFGFILNMTEGQGEADEVFQETWFRVIRAIGSYRQGNFLGWLVRIARNIVIDRARRRKPEVSLDVAPEAGRPLEETLPGKEPDPLGRLKAEETGRRVAAAVAELPLEQKEVFLMRVEAELPFKAIAAAQGVSINTALARMQYALAKLRVRLRDENEDV